LADTIIHELEVLQPHIAAGFSLSKVLDDLLQKTFNDVLQDLISQTNRTFAHSFLYPNKKSYINALIFLIKFLQEVRKAKMLAAARHNNPNQRTSKVFVLRSVRSVAAERLVVETSIAGDESESAVRLPSISP
jgi:hypothetical protein